MCSNMHSFGFSLTSSVGPNVTLFGLVFWTATCLVWLSGPSGLMSKMSKMSNSSVWSVRWWQPWHRCSFCNHFTTSKNPFAVISYLKHIFVKGWGCSGLFKTFQTLHSFHSTSISGTSYIYDIIK